MLARLALMRQTFSNLLYGQDADSFGAKLNEGSEVCDRTIWTPRMQLIYYVKKNGF